MDQIEKIIQLLDLKPLPVEGGYFRETYRSADFLEDKWLTNLYGSRRCVCTAIYYLITPDSFSKLHQVRSDEIFHFYAGDPVILLQLFADGSGRREILGNNLAAGMIPQAIVSAGVWQGSCLLEGGHYALLGTTVAPGFEYQDFILGDRKILITKYPQFKDEIKRLTVS
jgi:predicted cupin superfamily sugar epimerase